MKRLCPYCESIEAASELRSHVIKAGRYRRKSDCRIVQIFKCLTCRKYFSAATGHPCFGQKKRQINIKVLRDLASSTSMRRIALNLRVSRTTVLRKLVFLGVQAELQVHEQNLTKNKAIEVQFDDMETFEHTKCKPLSITLAAEKGTRRILAFEVSQMAAKGKLAKIALKKYGPRKDGRYFGRKKLFQKLEGLVEPTATFESDENPYYPKDLKRHFPNAVHITHKGQRGSIVGQGELKKIRFDPLFSLNHTCAMFRDNVKRLGRKTWCTTKKPGNLHAHLAIYALFHNNILLRPP